jgi:hypothetical protein
MARRLVATTLVVLAAALPAEAGQNDALTAARFSITIDGYEVASFSELATFDPKARSPTLVLRGGRSATAALWAWHEAAQAGQMAAARKSAVLVGYDRSGRAVARYHLTDAWPSKISIGRDRRGGKLAESLVIACRRVQRAAP